MPSFIPQSEDIPGRINCPEDVLSHPEVLQGPEYSDHGCKSCVVVSLQDRGPNPTDLNPLLFQSRFPDQILIQIKLFGNVKVTAFKLPAAVFCSPHTSTEPTCPPSLLPVSAVDLITTANWMNGLYIRSSLSFFYFSPFLFSGLLCPTSAPLISFSGCCRPSSQQISSFNQASRGRCSSTDTFLFPDWNKLSFPASGWW